ncbi:hypothetical protein GIB67_036697 [Kingdonia uniflora]|uniref:ALOG domain-containing protein n=1 Tax=Kingdonia uniflora TaxID=39325 RepID=A0A7J7LWP8_9MAGN|nr:hypothetical protein GIB67_036697 [Kingdonia uniflora]
MDDSKSGDGAAGDAGTAPSPATTLGIVPSASSSKLEPKSSEGHASVSLPPTHPQQPPSRYESQKRRDWNTFLQYLKNHKPPLTLARCSGAHVIEFLKYLDQFGKTKVHVSGCTYFGHPNPPAPCPCPSKQAWGSLDALIGRLRAAYEENGGKPESNPFGARAVRIYLREVRESQAKARGIPYEKKKRKRATTTMVETARIGDGSSGSNSGVVGSSTEAIVVAAATNVAVSSSSTTTTTTTTTTDVSASASASDTPNPV